MKMNNSFATPPVRENDYILTTGVGFLTTRLETKMYNKD
jgi:hypothetical protein